MNSSDLTLRKIKADPYFWLAVLGGLAVWADGGRVEVAIAPLTAYLGGVNIARGSIARGAAALAAVEHAGESDESGEEEATDPENLAILREGYSQQNGREAPPALVALPEYSEED